MCWLWTGWCWGSVARRAAEDSQPLGRQHCVSSVGYSELAWEPSFWIYRAHMSAEAQFSSLAYLGKAQMCLFSHKWWFECPIELCEECGFPLTAALGRAWRISCSCKHVLRSGPVTTFVLFFAQEPASIEWEY